MAAIRNAKASKGKGQLEVTVWDQLGQAALVRIVVEVILFAMVSVVITTVLHLLEAAKQTLKVRLVFVWPVFTRTNQICTLLTRQDRATSLNDEAPEEMLNTRFREEILQQLVGRQVLGIGLERLVADVSEAVSEETSKLDAGWCRGKCSFGEFADLIRRCVYTLNTKCDKVCDTISSCVLYWILELSAIMTASVVAMTSDRDTFGITK